MRAAPTVLFEDHDVVAVAKPAGIAVIPGRDEGPADALRGLLELGRGEKLFVVHRIDRDTSGVVLFARNAGAHRSLSLAFEHRLVSKRYVAFTWGVPAPGPIDVPLHPARKGRMRPARPGEPGALESHTDVEVGRTRAVADGVVAEVFASPRTGRQHQLRVHLRAAGAPLLVDPLYGPHDTLETGRIAANSPRVPRLTLHARALTVPHPRDGRPLAIDAPLTDDLVPLSDWLSGR